MEDKELAELEKQIQAKKEEPAASTPEPVPTPEPEEPPKPDFDASDLAKKKGWNRPEDAIKSYAELEKAFHEKTQEVSRLKEQQTYQPPVNPYTPPTYVPPAYPAYSPQNYAPRVDEQRVAESYGLSVEDFRKVLAVSKDMADVRMGQLQQEMHKWKEDQEKQYSRSSDMTEVMGDPAFQSLEVRKEIHEVLEKNPKLFNEKKPYSAALREALQNMGRKTITRGSESSESYLPTEPPKMAGSGSGHAPVRRSMTGLPSMQEAEKMKPEDLEKLLKGAKAFKTYADM